MAGKDVPTEEAALKKLADLQAEAVIKDSMIIEYRNALSEAHYKIAMLNGQLKLAHLSNEPTE